MKNKNKKKMEKKRMKKKLKIKLEQNGEKKFQRFINNLKKFK